jgi:hypothetical protein
MQGTDQSETLITPDKPHPKSYRADLPLGPLTRVDGNGVAHATKAGKELGGRMSEAEERKTWNQR